MNEHKPKNHYNTYPGDEVAEDIIACVNGEESRSKLVMEEDGKYFVVENDGNPHLVTLNHNQYHISPRIKGDGPLTKSCAKIEKTEAIRCTFDAMSAVIMGDLLDYEIVQSGFARPNLISLTATPTKYMEGVNLPPNSKADYALDIPVGFDWENGEALTARLYLASRGEGAPSVYMSSGEITPAEGTEMWLDTGEVEGIDFLPYVPEYVKGETCWYALKEDGAWLSWECSPAL